MYKEIKIKNKIIDIYYNEKHKENIPVVILNTYGNEGKEIFERCNKIQTKEFILIAISNLDWNNDMTPWFAPKLNNNDKDSLGKADDYLKTLIEKIIPETKKYIEDELNVKISYYAIAGYSLGGLFAIYSVYKTNLFSRVASASGSFWYPNFIEFASKNTISENIDKIYFSLGNKESKVRNEVLATVEQNTKKLEQIYNLQGIKTIYEENDGNHFKDAVLRMAKGIKWILQEYRRKIMDKYNRLYKGHSLIKKLNDYTVLDIETTSLDSFTGEIVEISAIKVRDKKEVETFSELIKTQNRLGAFTTRLTGITNEMVQKEGKDLIYVLQQFKDFLDRDIIVGHNVNFDINFIYDSMYKNMNEYLINDFVDTLRISRKVLPNLRHHKLDNLIDYFNLVKRDEHRALNDCVLTNQVYINLTKML